MMQIIRRYYLVTFVSFLIIFFVTYLPRKSPNNIWTNVLICVAGALLISLLCGTIYYLEETRWNPARKKKRMSKTPFRELYANGFTRLDDLVVGHVQGYEAIVTYNRPAGGKPEIRIDVLFDTGSLPANSLQQLIKRNKAPGGWHDPNYEWTGNSVGVTYSYAFTPPSFDRIMKKINELIAVLKGEGLSPMTLNEAQLLARTGKKAV